MKKRKKRRFKLIHLMTLFIIVYTVATFWNQRKMMNQLRTKEEDNRISNSQLEKEIKGLEQEIEESQTLQFVERVARDELGMVKPREIMVIDKNKKRNPFIKKIKKDK